MKDKSQTSKMKEAIQSMEKVQQGLRPDPRDSDSMQALHVEYRLRQKHVINLLPTRKPRK